MRYQRWLLYLLVFLLGSACEWARAQLAVPEAHLAIVDPPATFSLVTDREPMTSIAGLWRFQPGDNPRYADANYDDSHWKLLKSTEPWTSQGYTGLSGYAWYRFKVTLPAGSEPMSLLLPEIYNAYQCFADGRLLRTVGVMPRDGQAFPWGTVLTSPVVIPLGIGARTTAQAVSIALRVWKTARPNYQTVGGPYLGDLGSLTGMRVGTSSLIGGWFDSQLSVKRYNSSDSLGVGALQLLAAVIALSLYLLRKDSRDYLWFFIAYAFSGACYFFVCASPGHLWSGSWTYCITGLLNTTSWIAFLLFYKHLLSARANWLFRLAIAGHCLIFALFYGGFNAGLLAVSWASSLFAILILPANLWILFLLLRRSREGILDARILLIPSMLSILLFQYEVLRQVPYWHLGSILSYSPDHPVLHIPFPISTVDLAEVFYLLSLLGVIFHRFARGQREQDRIAAELEAARSLQHVLIPETLPTIPGLTIETAYYPAQEVGGDFFQVLPLATGDTLIVLGDVSGKGLPAAMTVSLIVGALRTLAEITNSPAEILAGLNRRLHGRGAGFTTCLALRFSPSGSLTVANAGHLAPYRNGRELPLPPELPLGLAPEVTLAEETFALAPGDHLMLLTDGVPEATCRRELFGFSRTESLSVHSATHMADAARSFGQSDDITVLTIDFAGVAATERPVLSLLPQPA